jgi:hypothetical protein
MSTTFYRSDRWVTDALGNAIAGASVAFCSQPANTSTQPPTPLIQLFADPAGDTPITNPLTTDGFGHAFAYMAQGTYTVVVYSPRIQTVILQDQVVLAPSQSVLSSWNSDSSSNGTITGTVNGSNVVFELSAAPVPVQSLVFTVNGLIQNGYTISGNTVTLPVAPHTANVLNAVYQIPSS